MREERRAFMENIREERKSVVESLKVKERFWEEKIRGLEEKIRGLEEKRIERENKVKEWIEKVEKKRQGNLIGEGEEEEERNVYSRGENIYSRAGSACSGRWSEGSTDRLSGKEIGAIRKLMGEKEREERKCNIVIKGFNWEGNKETEKGRERAKEFIKEKIRVDTEVVSWRMSGPVAIIKVGSEEMKREIMINKYKLRGGKVFFENDLNFEERRTQSMINRWVKAQENRRGDIKIGYGRVKIRGIWKDWKEIEREEEKRKKENNNNREREGKRGRVRGEARGKRNVMGNKRGGNMIFWNTAGIINKDKEFWKFIGKFEFISLSETWLEENGWKKIEGKLPSSHDWECVYAQRKKKRGRAKGGFIMGVKKGNGWGINARELREGGNERRFEKEIIRRERDGQRQCEESKLRAARYNVRYKEFDAGNRKHNYLRKENLGRIGIGEGVRGLVRLRCGNMEEGNKYWIEKEQKGCVFCGKETDCMEHYVGECQMVSSWFRELDENKEKVWKKLWSDELDSEKCKVLSKLERERKKEIEKKKKGRRR
ncbi:hypothetical protein ALC57_18336 [Trachymyrmex cornetzi]|uniref:Endonuclease/exonuclease/phosphatase domain-containing protein n=1 Tax=Trachymyrmex cornetzi TaxID=471704 RepID=A0A151IS61_9HYME|nr:hypothetical protein ALC57_18336 [Trachymyrmex cornetzi]